VLLLSVSSITQLSVSPVINDQKRRKQIARPRVPSILDYFCTV